jgi:hypothetical protein
MPVAADSTPASGLFPWQDLADECMADPRIQFFVGRESAHSEDVQQLLEWSEVLVESSQDQAFAEATSLRSYATFAALAHASSQSAAELTELTEQFSWRSLVRFLRGVPVLVLVLATLAITVFRQDYLTLAGQLAAIALAPATGLAWRGARLRHSTWRLALAVSLGAAGLAALVIPLVAVSSFPYWSWFLIVTFLGTTGIFALDHADRPRLRDIKVLLLMPRDRGREKRANAGRDAWLHEARDKAVSHELTQTINRLLAPKWERRLLVRDADGLRAIYLEDAQVPTLAAERAENALERSDGASIAVSGPRGSGKTNLLTELCRPESRFSLLVSAPTRYAPKEFLLELFQELCTAYIRDREAAARTGPARNTIMARPLPGRRVLALRIAVALVLTGLLAWDLTVRSAVHALDDMPKSLWADPRLFTPIVLAVLIGLAVPKRLGKWRRDPGLVAAARRCLAELRAELTATSQVGATLPMMPVSYSRAVAQRSLPWTMPELVGRLRKFLGQVCEEELRGRQRSVLICIDEVDRIGSAAEATQFLGEVKAIFGIPHCYFAVAIAEELGVEFGRRTIAPRSAADNAFDEIISLEPMSFEQSRHLLTRRVLGFTDSFVWLSLVMSGGLPRELIRVARRMVELTIESRYKRRLPEIAEQLIREEVYEAIVGSRSQIAGLSADHEYTPVLDTLRLLVKVFEPGRKAGDLRTGLLELAGLPTSVPAGRAAQVKTALTKLAALALLGITTYDAFKDSCLDPSGHRDTATGAAGPYEELAAARRELGVSAESCRAAVEQIRLALGLEEQPRRSSQPIGVAGLGEVEGEGEAV